MEKDDFEFALRAFSVVLISIVAFLVLLKVIGIWFDLPKDYGRRISEQSIKICADKGGTPVLKDYLYESCKGAK